MPTFEEDFERIYKCVREDVFQWCEALNWTPSAQQAEVLDCYNSALMSAPDSPFRMLSVKAGQGGGKTAAECVIAGHWAMRRPGARMRIGAGSIDQLKDTWMAEFREIMDKADPWVAQLFEIRTKDILVGGHPDWGIRLIPLQADTRVQGRHHPHLAIIVDECSGIDRSIFETLMGTLTNEDKFLGIFGNPNYRDTFQFDTFNSMRAFWTTLTINTEECPFADQKNIARLAELYGRDSDVYRVRVLGEFPTKDPQAVMSSDDLEACYRENKDRLVELVRGLGASKQFGIDYARKGDDDSVIARRSGLVVFPLVVHSHREPMDVLHDAFRMEHDARWGHRDALYVPDFDGMGQGVGTAPFRNPNRRVYEFHSSGKPFDAQYDDSITEAFFAMAELVKVRAIFLPNDQVLVQNLATRNFDITLKGKIKVESKKEWRRRLQLQQSPDRGDAVVQACYPAGPRRGRVSGGRSERLPGQEKPEPLLHTASEAPRRVVGMPRAGRLSVRGGTGFERISDQLRRGRW